ncbi:SpoIIE family protein phosphatase [Leisingera sp. ANG-Vp]|uniref:SpoIIE family protein phosphatase n=1 Tax=Leisingera sp. ANG-Vp TaxID=1577896 RepID=UPI00057D89E8|nr:SpoIIE family protein phosphatase [Leisingera sp. ANG-Vp]KIC19929.1 hypothetical protein RA20_11550 [Leisingera sp. ANG-Vp]
MTSGHIPLPGSDRQLNWSVAHKTKQAGQASGDGYLISRNTRSVLFAVADGSGSGKPAAAVTETCLAVLGSQGELGLQDGFTQCHRVLKGSRGAALGMILIDVQSSRFSWAAVGDVDGLLVRAAEDQPNETLIQRGGVLGVSLPRLHPSDHVMQPDDLIVMTSDGVKRAYRAHVRAGASADRTAADVMDRFAHPRDDSIVLAISMGRVR